MALAVSDGVCVLGGVIVVVATGFALAPAVVGACIWACAAPIRPATSKVAESTVLMTNPGLQPMWIMHICWVGNNRMTVKGNSPVMLSEKELGRYARHIVLREVGGPGQTAL